MRMTSSIRSPITEKTTTQLKPTEILTDLREEEEAERCFFSERLGFLLELIEDR